MNIQPHGGIGNVGYQPNYGSSPGRGINKKKFFKNNLHHNQNALLFGTELESRPSQPNTGASYAGMHD
jgi:hypothetical protein